MCLSGCVSSNFFKSLLHFLLILTKLGTHDFCANMRKKTMEEQIFKILMLKFLAIFFLNFKQEQWSYLGQIWNLIENWHRLVCLCLILVIYCSGQCMLMYLFVGMMSAAASLGLVLLWDIDAGLTQLDKYLYSKEDYIKVSCHMEKIVY